MPVVNPDGYESTWSHDRFWRKNKNRNGDEGDEDCFGVNLDRNFPAGFGGSSTYGSGESCSNHYRVIFPLGNDG